MATEAPQPAPAPAAKALTCPSCGGGVTLRAAGYTVSVACQYCSSILDVANPSVKLIAEYHQAAGELEIPLGTRGTLRGVEWEAIGHMRRSIDGAYPWEEYLLFNPYHGYRWLVTNGRGWSLGEMLTVTPEYRTFDTFSVGNQHFTRFFAESEAQVDSVIGEFYWRVAVGERVTTADWVAPGFMLSREDNRHEVSWTRLELLDAREIGKAFGVEAPRKPWPPLPHQRSPYSAWLGKGFAIAAIAAAFLIAVMVFMGGSGWSAAGTFPIPSDGREQSVTLGPIQFASRYQRVEIRAEVPALENGWVDLDYTLVNRSDQRVYQAYGAAERYSGRDSDGSWTEGSRNSSVSVASVPAGTYDLVVEYKGNRWTGAADASGAQGWMAPENQPHVTVEVRRGTLYASNLFLALAFILLPLLWALFRHIHFEQARQAESDFAPVADDDDEEDDE